MSKPVTLTANQTAVDLSVTAGPKAAVGTRSVRFTGTATIGGEVTARDVVFDGPRWFPDDPGLRLAVALPTPFKIVD